MAIARDTSGSWTQAAGNTTWTQAYTCTGSNGYLAVTVNITTVGDTITATATYAGAAMTAQFNLVGGDNRRVYYFYKLGPATGSNNIVITFSGTTTFATSMCQLLILVYLRQVSQTLVLHKQPQPHQYQRLLLL